MRKLLRVCARALLGAVLVIFGVGVAKAAQLTSVDLIGPSLGFDLASLIGVLPVIITFLWLATRTRSAGR